MSFETKTQSVITKIRIELRDLRNDLQTLVVTSGNALPASETAPGVLEIATQAETDAGTNNTTAVTPLKLQTRLAAFAQPLNANLTTLAGVVSGATGRALLGATTAAAAKTTLALSKADVGLGNVDNTSDVNKPVSTAQQTALNLKADTTALPTKTSLGLGNVDNTSDIDKPVSTAQQTALNLKADTTALPTKTSLGLGNVDNTSDAAKPVSTAQQTALNLKANLASPSLTGTPTAPTAAAGTSTTQIATTAFTTAAVAAAVPAATPAATETVSGILELATQTEVNAGTDDARAVTPLKFQTRLAAYAQPLSANLTTLAGVVSGAMGRTLISATDAAAAKTALALTKADVGLGSVDNTADTAKPVSTAQQTALNLKANLASPALTGTPTAPTAAAGTSTTQVATTAFTSAAISAAAAWAATELASGVVRLATQTETDTGTDDSRALTPLKLQTRLAAFAQPLNANLTTLASVVSGATGRALLAAADAAAAKTALALVKADVGLGSVDNTSDAAKPVSTAQQTALNLKANLASPALSGTPTAPTAASGTNTTQVATTAFTTAAIANQTVASETATGILELATQAETDSGTDNARAVTPLKLQTRLAAYAQPLSANLTTLAAVTSGAMGRTLLAAADAATAKTALSLVKGDVGLGNADNTSDVAKPVSTAQQTALNLKANLASPNLTGAPTAPTAPSGTATDQIANTSYVQAAMGDLSSGMVGIIDGGGVDAGAGGPQGLNDGGTP